MVSPGMHNKKGMVAGHSFFKYVCSLLHHVPFVSSDYSDYDLCILKTYLLRNPDIVKKVFGLVLVICGFLYVKKKGGILISGLLDLLNGVQMQ